MNILEYHQAILKETICLFPARPPLVPHESLEDCTLAGYNIPTGTRRLLIFQNSIETQVYRWIQLTFDLKDYLQLTRMLM